MRVHGSIRTSGRLAAAWMAAALVALGGALPWAAFAQDAVCARVRIEIKQELTLERQAFEAEMQITHAADTSPMSQIAINVVFSDENGNPVKTTTNPNDSSGQAAFFIRIDGLEGIQNITGSGTIEPGASAKIRWLMIPVPGSGGSAPTGKLYLVGATVSYKLGAEPKTIDVAPDSIYVKPLPKLALDYFLTNEVYADDPFTTAIEPPEPFTLGVRVKNNGAAPARNLKIESAQPKITENTQGLLINFRLTGSYVNDQPANNSLLINFGDLPAQRASTGRWNMITTLSGRFVEFDATFAHADELGGAVTSLLDRTSAHLLVRDVRVDLPGRDGVRDFLARDGDALRVFESEGSDAPVTDQSGLASLAQGATQGGSTAFQLNAPPTQGFFYAKLSDPFAGTREPGSVVRADGKAIAPENVWLSKTRNQAKQWEYFINFFDADTPGQYSLAMAPRSTGPQPPVLQFVPDRTVREGQRVSFVVEASDPNGDAVKLSLGALPSGASFSDSGGGRAVFDWTPQPRQAGVYALRFDATDGALRVSQTATLTVQPREPPAGPELPVIVAPLPDTQVRVLRPILLLAAASPLDSVQRYRFEIYADAALGTLIAQGEVVKGAASTSFKPPADLIDNTRYFWRARAFDGSTWSEWVNASFFVNQASDAPRAPLPGHPREGTEVDSLQPLLWLSNSSDADDEPLTYGFELFGDRQGQQRIAGVVDLPPGTGSTTAWQVPVALIAGREYWWRASARDPRGAISETRLQRFTVDPRNRAPGAPVAQQPAAAATVAEPGVTLAVGPAQDADGDALSYVFELDRAPGFDGPSRRASPPIAGTSSGASWAVSGLVENTRYYWRARASDGRADGPWAGGEFLASRNDDAPPVPQLRNLGPQSWTESLRPRFELAPVTDPEGGPVTYGFQVFADAALQTLVAEGEAAQPEWLVPVELVDGQTYHWRGAARDSAGNTSGFGPPAAFRVSRAPAQLGLALTAPAAIVEPREGKLRIVWEVRDPLNATRLALYVDRDDSGADGTLIRENIALDPQRRGGEYEWDVSTLAPGAYHVYATASNGERTVTRYAPGMLLVPSPSPKGRILARKTSNSDLSEIGSAGTLQVSLANEPSAEVRVPVHATRPDEASTSPSTLTFDASNWSTWQSVTVRALNDCLADGVQTYRVLTGRAESRDPNYAGVRGDPLTYTTADDDSPSQDPAFAACNIRIVSTKQLSTREFAYTMVLDVTNLGPAVSGLRGTLTSTTAATTVLDPQVVFGPIGSGATATSQDTFTIRQDRRFPFDAGALRWTFQPAP